MLMKSYCDSDPESQMLQSVNLDHFYTSDPSVLLMLMDLLYSPEAKCQKVP